jgi:hypothetical protein
MDHAEYRELEVGISRELNAWFRLFCEKNPEYKEIETAYTRKDIHLNGIQFVAGFHAHSKEFETWKKFSGIPVAIELVMIWAYKTNRIIDHKQEVWKSEAGIVDTVLEHDIILSCILKILDDLAGLPIGNARTYALSFLRELPLGFLIERQKLKVTDSSTDRIKDNWEESYRRRNIMFNALYDFCPLIGYAVASGEDVIPRYVANVPEEMRFSHVGQVINDLSDCYSEHDAFVKTYQDQYADARNAVITYPLFRILDSPLMAQALEKPEITRTKGWQDEVTNLMKEAGIDGEVKQLAKECYHAQSDFWDSLLGERDEFVVKTYGLLRDNKYFRQF